jgi:hypothetical protein
MKVLTTLLGFVNGAYMLFDGCYVMLHHKYLGPPQPGPWANLFYCFNVDVFKLGPLFVLWGLAWLLFVVLLWLKPKAGYLTGLLAAVFTLWYLPVGTVVSLAVLLILFTRRSKLRLEIF